MVITMTLKEMKKKTFSLIEEYYPNEPKLAEDEDVINKINGIVNSIQLDLMKYRKINASQVIKIRENDKKIFDIIDILDDCYQLNKLYFDEDNVDYEMITDTIVKLPDDFIGEFTIYYYKYPILVETEFENDTEALEEDEDFEFELDPVLLEIMPYGIASDLLKMDMISGYGRYFNERYQELKNAIDTRKNTSNIFIRGGVEI